MATQKVSAFRQEAFQIAAQAQQAVSQARESEAAALSVCLSSTKRAFYVTKLNMQFGSKPDKRLFRLGRRSLPIENAQLSQSLAILEAIIDTFQKSAKSSRVPDTHEPQPNSQNGAAQVNVHSKFQWVGRASGRKWSRSASAPARGGGRKWSRSASAPRRRQAGRVLLKKAVLLTRSEFHKQLPSRQMGLKHLRAFMEAPGRPARNSASRHCSTPCLTTSQRRAF